MGDRDIFAEELVNINEEIAKKIDAIDRVCKADPMNRGLISKINPSSLLSVTKQLISCNNVWIATGFPILAAGIGENDGPAGAAVIAEALYKLGKQVTIITDTYSEKLVLAALSVLKTPVDVICSPIDDGEEFLRNLQREKTPDTIITIERPSKGSDGLFHSMRGVDISSMVSDTDILLESEATTISIGDGGNECGMGCFYDEICLYIPCGQVIAAKTCCDYPLVAGISNYYGWGIAAALSLISRRELLSDELVQIAVIDAISQSGGVDGTKGIISSSVDGQPLEDYIEVYRKISYYLP